MSAEKNKVKDLKAKLCYETKNQWDEADKKFRKQMDEFCAEYKTALDMGKTERSFYNTSVRALEAAGFVDLNSKQSVKAGDKVYRGVHGKGLLAAVVGSLDPAEGFLLIGSHIDSPRLDLKPNPVYEKNEMVLLKTHYYGGIKKYQWAATALALQGVVILKDNTKVEINIGLAEEDPVFTITDLLPHLGKDQMAKKASEVIEGESMNILFGGIPYPDSEVSERFKLAVLQLLNERYGIVERDLLSAEIEVVPAQKAKDVGLDRSFVGSYGQDDRVCAWTSLKALTDAKSQKKTQGILFFDKEETGSDGNTGACSDLYLFALHELHCKMIGREASLSERQKNIENSMLLSSDVTNAYDPNYPEVSDPLNSTYCGKGIGIAKYTGSRGKGGTTDANAEYFHFVSRLFDAHSIPWQVGELGKVDQGGGGTIAKIFANDGMHVIDCGVPVLSMHSCFEVTSKIDVYNTYRAYKCFLENA